jgi:hypothetical protein
VQFLTLTTLTTYLFFLPLYHEAQEVRSVAAVRIHSRPVVDGLLQDSCWMGVEPAKDFIQIELQPGKPSQQKAEVRFVYDDDALYIGAQLFDTAPDSVLWELSTRDNEANADLFGVLLDTYNDDINAYGFYVTAAGTQIDARYSSEGQDFDWNAVWRSSVRMNKNGWAVEFEIPYSALRFSKKEQQVWGMNILRKIRRSREASFWNTVDPGIDALVRQFGDLTGLQNIKPPLRLSLTPYVAGIADHFPYNEPNVKNLTYNISGGMDIKYGINDAFTLDMTLVPDFSQVQSDNQVLNLSPFEVQFQERRPFFTEGTELFNKGGLFYSRRVGGLPINYAATYKQLQPGERVLRNPSQTQLLNATKLSGRTAKKLGIGLFNGLSREAHAIIQDSEGGTRSFLTSPLTNYNILVLDQTLKNNSFITFINTNVTRAGRFYDANVTGVSARFNDKGNRYSFGASSNISNRMFADSTGTQTGYSANVDFGKSGGNFKWMAFGRLKTDKYNPNDLGILFLTNNIETGLQLQYNIYKPFWKLNNMFNNVTVMYQRMYVPNAFWNFGIYGESVTTFTKRFLTCGINYGAEPVITYDYYEPRIGGRFYTFPINYSGGGFISSDYRKPFALDVWANYRTFLENNRQNSEAGISPRYRVNNRLSFVYEISDSHRRDDIGFVNYNDESDTVTFGRRNMRTVSNIISSIYKFSNKMSLSFRLRHYWSSALYKGYYNLGQDGLLYQYGYGGDHNVNFNAFNIDMVFFWQFAPGSELNIVWKNAVLQSHPDIVPDYYTNFRNSFSAGQNNTLSVKVLFYVDYLNTKRSLKRSPK